MQKPSTYPRVCRVGGDQQSLQSVEPAELLGCVLLLVPAAPFVESGQAGTVSGPEPTDTAVCLGLPGWGLTPEVWLGGRRAAEG